MPIILTDFALFLSFIFAAILAWFMTTLDIRGKDKPSGIVIMVMLVTIVLDIICITMK